jgi:cytochrome b
MSPTVRVWDLPTRAFHWALVFCFAALIVTGQTGGSAMVWHFRFGYATLTLLLFRFFWGFVGGHWSRFSSFIYAPRTVINYVKGRFRPEHTVGHNPLGAASVFAMLGFLAVQVSTGLFSDDEIANAGPLSRFVSGAVVNAATWYHKDIGKFILLALTLLHIGAILFYWFKKRENLVGSMVLGDKQLSFPATNSRDDNVSRLLALIVLTVCGLLVAWLVSLEG